MDIEHLLTQPENKTLEFKRDLSSLKPILKTVVAFANTAGGVLIVGYSPEKGVLGISDVLQAEESLTNSISDNISSSLQPEVDIQSFDGKNLLIVRVAHQKGPYFLKSEGNLEGVYMRFGSSSRKAGPDILADLVRHNGNRSFDQLPCADLERENLDSERITRFLEKIRKPREGLASLKTLGVLTTLSKQLVPSNGGIILFGKDAARDHCLWKKWFLPPQHFEPHTNFQLQGACVRHNQSNVDEQFGHGSYRMHHRDDFHHSLPVALYSLQVLDMFFSD